MNKAILASDHLDSSDRTAMILGQLGWEVYVVAAEKLLDEHLRNDEPALMLVDIEMDKGSGFDLILKARRRFADLFIIAATRGSDRDLWPGLAKMCGADRYMVGPVCRSKLVSEIESGVANSCFMQESAMLRCS
ncbi:MAG: response regulator [Woeseiaceae bacterium]